ncbi:MAG: hypothetical protein H0T69_00850 [Thermoleophilaceae bacterium]|nr:hypothetical protein [Thermoleophilaceae bacterium]
MDRNDGAPGEAGKTRRVRKLAVGLMPGSGSPQELIPRRASTPTRSPRPHVSVWV